MCEIGRAAFWHQCRRGDKRFSLLFYSEIRGEGIAPVIIEARKRNIGSASNYRRGILHSAYRVLFEMGCVNRHFRRASAASSVYFIVFS